MDGKKTSTSSAWVKKRKNARRIKLRQLEREPLTPEQREAKVYEDYIRIWGKECALKELIECMNNLADKLRDEMYCHDGGGMMERERAAVYVSLNMLDLLLGGEAIDAEQDMIAYLDEMNRKKERR